jgi:hypothetical protein
MTSRPQGSSRRPVAVTAPVDAGNTTIITNAQSGDGIASYSKVETVAPPAYQYQTTSWFCREGGDGPDLGALVGACTFVRLAVL